MRIGAGFDCHRFAPGRPLILGGVEVPHSQGLLGHSDADVLSHAIGDALLGAAGLGDLGRHFPDTDERYRGVSSLELLRQVLRMVKGEGFVVGNVDATVVAERPRLAPHIEAMREGLAEALGVDGRLVSVKATTTEGLGFPGREEGIAAHAVCLLKEVDEP